MLYGISGSGFMVRDMGYGLGHSPLQQQLLGGGMTQVMVDTWGAFFRRGMGLNFRVILFPLAESF